MFHWVTGIPFQSDLHGGAYDDLTLWEQIDEGAHYTPAKKWLFSVPIALYVASFILSRGFSLIYIQILGLDALHELQSMALRDQPLCSHLRAHPQAPSGKNRHLAADRAFLSPPSESHPN